MRHAEVIPLSGPQHARIAGRSSRIASLQARSAGLHYTTREAAPYRIGRITAIPGQVMGRWDGHGPGVGEGVICVVGDDSGEWFARYLEWKEEMHAFVLNRVILPFHKYSKPVLSNRSDEWEQDTASSTTAGYGCTCIK